MDIETNRVRIRPSNNQGIPADLVIECSREYSDTTKFPLGTKFIAEDVVVYNKQLAELIR
ncbi:hypothetical protein [Chryseobacterium limigenitum]|uniref:hypothetical protein n=1 Tax=Chryseobacterium limigenitum TaxID=1612149 RepID=UPI001114DB3E|nr:hypothetical protein [Chryseobacterium limigenitum]